MEKEKNNKGLIATLIIIIVILAALCILFATGTISLKSDKDDITEETTTTTNAEDISISILSMNKPTISNEAPNHMMTITGEMKLSFDEGKYTVVNMVGSCTGKDGEKYNIFGPSSGTISLHNGETEYTMVETIGNQDDVIYPDGTKKEWKDIDWTKVEIKSCEIESLRAYYFVNNDEILLTRKINYKKDFK